MLDHPLVQALAILLVDPLDRLLVYLLEMTKDMMLKDAMAIALEVELEAV